MSLFRDLFTDLVEKRLWPFALVLLAALVAVPLALSKPAPPAPPPVAAPHATPDGIAPGEPVVSVAQPAHKAALLGHPHDPFKQLYLPKATPADLGKAGGSATPSPSPPAGNGATGSGNGTSSGGGTPPPSPAPSGGGGGGGGTPPPSTGPSTPPPSRGPSTPPSSPPAGQPDLLRASIDLRFGRADAPLRLIKRLPPLSALPSASDPVIIYLGLLHDKRTAVFLVSADARPSGDGHCRPTHGACQTVRLLPGQSEFFDVKRADGSVVQYELDLGRVSPTGTKAGTGAAAKAGTSTEPRSAVSLHDVQVTAKKLMPDRSVDATSLAAGPPPQDPQANPTQVGASTGIALVPKLQQFAPEGATPPAPAPGSTPAPEAEGDSPGGLPKLHGLSVP